MTPLLQLAKVLVLVVTGVVVRVRVSRLPLVPAVVAPLRVVQL
jgi:hypothetical protein